jgi:hypothetical protein
MVRNLANAWQGFQFEILIAFICALSGIPLAFSIAPRPTSIVVVLPELARIVWGISLSLGGSLVLVGIIWRYNNPIKFISGLYLERAGLYMLGSSTAVFVLAIIVFAGANGFFSGMTYGAFASACLSRTMLITREISIIREHGTSE